MENKINIAELLKDCPKGMELDCTMWENCTFDEIQDVGYINIVIKTPNGYKSLDKNGRYSRHEDSAKCVIFPKGKTTWEGFQRPFEDGDIVATSDGWWIGITTGGKIDEFIPTYCVINHADDFEAYLDRKETWKFSRFATEEEKQKLFNAIKENGYKWNANTNTLEKLPKTKFKVGDRIKNKNVNLYHMVNDILGGSYIVDDNLVLDMKMEHLYELAPDIKPKFKIGDRIKKDKDLINGVITNISDDGSYKVEYQGGGVSYVYPAYQDDWELVPDKFDVINFEPFMKVLVRSDNSDVWECDFFSLYNPKCSNRFHCIGAWYNICIPYIGNEHLLGTTNDCDEFYKNWE